MFIVTFAEAFVEVGAISGATIRLKAAMYCRPRMSTWGICNNNNNNNPDWVSNGKQTARKCFQEDRKIKRAHRLTSLHTIHRDGTKKKR